MTLILSLQDRALASNSGARAGDAAQVVECLPSKLRP
jgi:hypothetical protein